MSTTLEVSLTGSDTIESEIKSYLDSVCDPITSNPLTYWHNNKTQFKKLFIIAQNVLEIPASYSACSTFYTSLTRSMKM